jgi:hypothetical protein
VSDTSGVIRSTGATTGVRMAEPAEATRTRAGALLAGAGRGGGELAEDGEAGVVRLATGAVVAGAGVKALAGRGGAAAGAFTGVAFTGATMVATSVADPTNEGIGSSAGSAGTSIVV